MNNNNKQNLKSDCDTSLDHIVSEYIDAVIEGDCIDKQAIYSQYPDFRAELEEMLSSIDQFFEAGQTLSIETESVLLELNKDEQQIVDRFRIEWEQVDNGRMVDVINFLNANLLIDCQFQIRTEAILAHVVYIDLEQRVKCKMSLSQEWIKSETLSHFETNLQSAIWHFAETKIGSFCQPGGICTLGNYELDSIAGEGGQGFVIKARHKHIAEEDDRPIAIKILKPNIFHSFDVDRRVQYIERFVAEASVMKSLSADNLDVHDVGNDGPFWYIVTEWIEGQNAREYIEKNGPLKLASAIQRIEKIASSVAKAHDKNVVHRDIKPSNIMFGDNNRTYLIDFGLTRLIFVDDADSKPIRRVSESHSKTAMEGTPEYLAPEQITGSERIHTADQRSDIYTLGGTLLYLVTGETRRNFDGSKSYLEIIQAIRAEDDFSCEKYAKSSKQYEKVRQEMGKDRVAFEKIIDRCLKKHPEERFPSVNALVTELRTIGKSATHLGDNDTIIADERMGLLEKAYHFAGVAVSAIFSPLGFATIVLMACSLLFAWRNSRMSLDVDAIQSPGEWPTVEVLADPDNPDSWSIIWLAEDPRTGKNDLRWFYQVNGKWADLAEHLDFENVQHEKIKTIATDTRRTTLYILSGSHLAKVRGNGEHQSFYGGAFQSGFARHNLAISNKGTITDGIFIERHGNGDSESESRLQERDVLDQIEKPRVATCASFDSTGSKLSVGYSWLGQNESTILNVFSISGTETKKVLSLGHEGRIFDSGWNDNDTIIVSITGTAETVKNKVVPSDATVIYKGRFESHIQKNCYLNFWKAKDGKLLKKIKFPRMCLSLAITPCGKFAAVGHDAKTGPFPFIPGGMITFWEIKSHRKVYTYRGVFGSVRSLAFTPDGKHLVAAGSDEIRIIHSPKVILEEN